MQADRLYTAFRRNIPTVSLSLKLTIARSS